MDKRLYETRNSLPGMKLNIKWLNLLFEFFSSFLCGRKIEDYGINTITQTCRRRAVFEYVSEVCFTLPAHNFRALHTVRVIRSVDQTSFRNWFKKTRPATAALKFAIAGKQGIATGSTVISSNFLM